MRIREVIAQALYDRTDPDTVGWINCREWVREKYRWRADQVIAALEEEGLLQAVTQ